MDKPENGKPCESSSSSSTLQVNCATKGFVAKQYEVSTSIGIRAFKAMKPKDTTKPHGAQQHELQKHTPINRRHAWPLSCRNGRTGGHAAAEERVDASAHQMAGTHGRRGGGLV